MLDFSAYLNHIIFKKETRYGRSRRRVLLLYIIMLVAMLVWYVGISRHLVTSSTFFGKASFTELFVDSVCSRARAECTEHGKKTDASTI